MRRTAVAMLVASVIGVACTDAGSDPNAVVAIRFDGSAYPSIVVDDSLRDSTGAVQPLQATGLNYRGEPVPGAEIVFSSPDTNLRLFGNGVVFARSRKTDGTPARVFATIGSLQSQPDSLLIAPRADSIRPVVVADTANFLTSGSLSPEEIAFTVFGDTAANRPKIGVPGWLVTFQLRYRNVMLAPTDTTVAYTTIVTTRRVPSFVDTTDASGRAGRRVFVRAPRAPEDTVFVIATVRRRTLGSLPLQKETRLILLPGSTTTTRAPSP